jgi:Na+/H+ antiporter NhaD/arsenite permease-like protein
MGQLMRLFVAVLVVAACLSSEPARAASALDGASMTWPWALPFIGILLSIAIGPLLVPKTWHDHYGKIALGWAAVTLAPLAIFYGASAALAIFLHTMVAEYMSFILLLFALYTVAGGILVTGSIRPNPRNNAGALALGTVIASIVGTTGAAMILIRPLIRTNACRKHNAHVIVFFIILAANVGGALTPVGDPPLLVGFLHGVPFFWTTQHLWLQTVIVAVPILALFVAVDLWYFRKEPTRSAPAEPLRVHGSLNLILLSTIVAAVLLSATGKLDIALHIAETEIELRNLLRNGVLIVIALVSLWLTPEEHRAANGFTWEPIREVAILFACIFVAIIPVVAMLKAGESGTFAFLLHAVTTQDGSAHEAAYFWLSGGLSAFLDNAPTYLIFFELAGGDAKQLTGPLAGILASISMGAVYMGALTYLGNAPNLLIYAIARERGVRMPNFFAYMLWAGIILIPLFMLITLLPIPPILKLPR